MESYERRIGLKTIFLTFARRFTWIILIFVPIAVVAVGAIHFGMKKNYQSTAVVQKNAVFAAAHYQTFNSIVVGESTAKEAAENLAANSVVHSNKDPITYNEIMSGLSLSTFNSSNQSINVSIYFKSKDQSITQKVLEEVSNISVAAAIEKDKTMFAGLAVTTQPAEGKDISNIKKYYIIALAADLVLALGVPFIWEIVADEVYDKEDVESLGCEGFTLKIR